MRAALQWLLNSFLKGLLLVVPLTVTAWVFWFVFDTVDRLLGLRIPGFGFLFTVFFVMAIGALASTFLVDRFMAALEAIMRRVPLVKIVYFSLKDFMGAFVGEKKSFRQPVLVSLGPDAGAKVVGFVTAEELDLPGAEDHIAVYLPQSYNFAGNLILVPRARVTPLPAEESSMWLTFIVSGGVSRGSGRGGAAAVSAPSPPEPAA